MYIAHMLCSDLGSHGTSKLRFAKLRFALSGHGYTGCRIQILENWPQAKFTRTSIPLAWGVLEIEARWCTEAEALP